MKTIKNILDNFLSDNLDYSIFNYEKNEALINQLKQKEIPFVTKDYNKRLDVNQYLPDCTTIIVIGQKCNIDLIDYHITMQKTLQEMADALQQQINFEYKILVDNHNLVERDMAYRSGLGYYGKNGFIINDKLGSYFNIGLILTNLSLEIPPIKLQENKCGNCDKCLTACTVNFDMQKCISYLTQKKSLSDNEALNLNNNLYGCLTCQFVCPKNDTEAIQQTIDNLQIVKEKLVSGTPFENYKDYCFYWRGENIILRNAKL